MTISGFTTPSGLSAKEAQKRLAQFGPNAIGVKKAFSPFFDFLLKFKNPLVLLLLGAALLSFFVGEAKSATIIVAIIVCSVGLDFFNTYRSQKAIDFLRAKVRVTVEVVRDNESKRVELLYVVLGDIVLLDAGDIVPADGALLFAKDFFVNESSLTGESFPVEKEKDSLLYMGSSVVTGNAVLEVRATGKNTKYSNIAKLLGQEFPTEFDKNMQDLGFLMMKITSVLVVLIFFVNAFLGHGVLDSVLFAVALAVGITPELLPMIFALTLSRGSLEMSKRGVIVKKLSSIESFGSMDILCTDKTGTLTENRIVLIQSINGENQPSENVFLYAYVSSMYHTGFQSPLDEAIKVRKSLDISAYKKIDEIPFDYARKRDSVVMEHGSDRILISKGAPEELFAACAWYETERTAFSAEYLARTRNVFNELSAQGFRVLAIAIKKIHDSRTVYSKDDEEHMVFLGFVAFMDPPKKTVPLTLQLLKQYGVHIKVLTGDNLLITQKIAKEIHLEVQGILLSSEIDALTDDALAVKAENTTLFVRVSPEQKMRIIKALQKKGHVVGYLGDGINDAPSLRAADIGISVNNAIDVAKESADIILLRKNLHELIEGIIVGRETFVNTTKYLKMTLSSNLGNVFTMAIGSLLLPFFPALPVQILLGNLLVDVSQVAIPLDNVDKRDIAKPEKFNLSFLRNFMLSFGPLNTAFDLFTFGLLFYVFHFAFGAFQAGWFIENVGQIFALFVIRTTRIPFFQSKPSKYLLFGVFATVFVGWTIPFTNWGRFFNFSPIPVFFLPLIAGILLCYVVSVWLLQRKLS